MIYVFSVALEVACFFIRRKFLFYIFILFLWILFAFSSNNADYSTYEYQYKYYASLPSYSIFVNDVGFKLLCRIFYNAGFSYQSFLVIESLVGLGLIGYVIHKYSKHPNIVLALYFIYPFMIDVTQVRNFLAMSILIFATTFLIDEKKSGIIIFFLLNLLATSIHVVFLFYYLFLLIPLFKRKYLKIFIIGALCIEVLIFYKIESVIAIITNVNKASYYFSLSISPMTSLIIVMYFIMNFFLVFYVFNKLKSSNLSDKEKNMFKAIVNINIVMLFFLPFIFYSFEFMRIFRNILILNYILYSNYFAEYIRFGRFAIHSLGIMPLVVIFVMVSNYIFIYNNFFENVIIPLFQNNLLLH